MTVEWMWLGAASDSGITVSMGFGASATVGCRVATDSAFTSTVWTTSDGTTATHSTYGGNRAKITVTGLSPQTHYWVQGHDGTSYTGPVGEFWTPPPPGDPSGFELVHTSCTETVTTAQSTGDLTAARALAFGVWGQPGHAFHLGDLHYRDTTSPNETDPTNRAGFITDQLYKGSTVTTLSEILRRRPVVYMHDDHDFASNDSDRTDGTSNAQRLAYDDVVPHHPFAASSTSDTYNSCYHSFQVGRVWFIVTDLRSNRDPNSDTDNSTKSMLDADTTNRYQRTWLYEQFQAAAAAKCSFIVWANTQVWPGGAAPIADEWDSFSTERTAIADYLAANPDVPKVVIVSGDMHAIGRLADSDESTAQSGTGAIDVFNAAALNKAGTQIQGSGWDFSDDYTDGVHARLCLRECDGRWLDWAVCDDNAEPTRTARQVDTPTAISLSRGTTFTATTPAYADGHNMSALVELA